VAIYHWYCPECGREDYEDEDETEEIEETKVCDSCGAELCKMESGADDESERGSDK
jgi:uncharacterized Zn ribbon protein